MSLGEAAKALHIGVAELSSYEHARAALPANLIPEMAKLYGVIEADIVDAAPTTEQVTEGENKMNRFLAILSGAKAHAKQQGLGRRKGGRGDLPCPSGCGGTLRYSVAGVNGHMHARCSTEGCASWME